jgi:hypothetical protein
MGGKRTWTPEQRAAQSARSTAAREAGKIPNLVLTNDRPNINTWRGVPKNVNNI